MQLRWVAVPALVGLVAVVAVVAVVAGVALLGGPADGPPPQPAAGPERGGEPGPAPAAEPEAEREPEYEDAIAREIRRLASQPRPVPASALPPRHLDTERFPESLVERDRIVSGGPPPDGIPAIDAPRFVAVDDVDWIADQEPVLVLDLGDADGGAAAGDRGAVRVYPMQIMIWHEIVNDVVGDRPITVTYCPLCNSALAYDAQVGDLVLDFGTSGSLYQSAMVMYDRQTETLWTHFDGRAVIGELVGIELDLLPVATVRWADVVENHPDAEVLSLDTGFERRYGSNPYGAYGTGAAPLPGFFSADPDDRFAPMTRVVGVADGDAAVVVPIDELASAGVSTVQVGARRVSIWHLPGAPWAIGADRVGEAEATGATAVFDPNLDGRELSFERDGEVIVDTETGSVWTIFGEAVTGPLTGARLEPVVHLDTFWFAWSTYRPDTEVLTAAG